MMEIKTIYGNGFTLDVAFVRAPIGVFAHLYHRGTPSRTIAKCTMTATTDWYLDQVGKGKTDVDAFKSLVKSVAREIKRLEIHPDLRPSQVNRLDVLRQFVEGAKLRFVYTPVERRFSFAISVKFGQRMVRCIHDEGNEAAAEDEDVHLPLWQAVPLGPCGLPRLYRGRGGADVCEVRRASGDEGERRRR